MEYMVYVTSRGEVECFPLLSRFSHMIDGEWTDFMVCYHPTRYEHVVAEIGSERVVGDKRLFIAPEVVPSELDVVLTYWGL